MKVSLASYSILALGMANAIIFINLWSAVGVTSPTPVVERRTAMVSPPNLDVVVPTFEKVVRHSDISVTHLFGPSSSEQPGGKALAEPTQETGPTLRLIGVISNEGNVEDQIALLDRGGGAGIMKLHIGSKITPQGWQLIKIKPRSVELIRGKETKELALE